MLRLCPGTPILCHPEPSFGRRISRDASNTIALSWHLGRTPIAQEPRCCKLNLNHSGRSLDQRRAQDDSPSSASVQRSTRPQAAKKGQGRPEPRMQKCLSADSRKHFVPYMVFVRFISSGPFKGLCQNLQVRNSGYLDPTPTWKLSCARAMNLIGK